MRVGDRREVPLLDRHLHRLRQSARYFSFKYDSEKVQEAISEALPREPGFLRLLLSQSGEVELSSGPLPSRNAQHLKLSHVRVNSKDPFLYHKTTKRDLYEEARRVCDEDTDAILVNERDEITETTITNIAVFRDGTWITPVVTCGLLPGVMRAELLAYGKIVEGVIHVSELSSSEPIRCFNAVRGVFEAELNAG
jgi:para-aminobenzoate synthetase/4-amino-4-deoxychorismate lyase